MFPWSPSLCNPSSKRKLRLQDMTTEGAARKVARAAGTAMRRAVGVEPGNRWEDLMKEARASQKNSAACQEKAKRLSDDLYHFNPNAKGRELCTHWLTYPEDTLTLLRFTVEEFCDLTRIVDGVLHQHGDNHVRTWSIILGLQEYVSFPGLEELDNLRGSFGKEFPLHGIVYVVDCSHAPV